MQYLDSIAQNSIQVKHSKWSIRDICRRIQTQYGKPLNHNMEQSFKFKSMAEKLVWQIAIISINNQEVNHWRCQNANREEFQ